MDPDSEVRDPPHTTYQISISSRLLDGPGNCFNHFLNGTREALSCMVSLWMEPIIDARCLNEVSIGILVVDRLTAAIQKYESIHRGERPHIDPETLEFVLVAGAEISLGLVAIAFALGMAVAFVVVALLHTESQQFAPLWDRVILPRQEQNSYGGSDIASTAWTFLLLLLFCIESILMVSIVLFGCHAAMFPEWIEDDVKILTALMGLWLISLLASSLVRYCF